VFLWDEDRIAVQQQADAFASACALLNVAVVVMHTALDRASVAFIAHRPPTDSEIAAAVAEIRNQCEVDVPIPRLSGC